MRDWQRVQLLFDEALSLPEPSRLPFLEAACNDDSDLLAEVCSLLKADEDSDAVLDAAVREEATLILDTTGLTGERFGVYRIVREIGRGGMGVVYLATRDDEEYRKEVALKVVKRGMDTDQVLRRFRHERQILASLEHPYIARLFDGGSTQSGLPFFVMEYIEGQPITRYCHEEGLNFAERCRLFLLVLDAVAYAHRNLIVHRDLKPSNILVTRDGVPKLLDFGVAKLLGSDDADQTARGDLRPFTPGYASPEQVRGETITTSTDIYSLGSVLYELLTRQRAQTTTERTPAEIERSVCKTEVSRPSLIVNGLPSDLDNIVLMAMRKEPERRYQSAVQFAEDIRRCLDGRPVLARQDSRAYRMQRFIGRNALQVAAGVAVALALVAGLAVSLVQASHARAERRIAESQRIIAVRESARAESARLAESIQAATAEQQRLIALDRSSEAERQRGLAEERVKEILGLANHALFDVHDAILPLSGSVAARRTLVATTLNYLQTLEKGSTLDDPLRLVLATGYYKLALMQGDLDGASLQDSVTASKSLQKAEAILRPAYKRSPNDATVVTLWIEIQSRLDQQLFVSGHLHEAVSGDLALLPLARQLVQMTPCPMECRIQESTIENNLNDELTSTDPSKALEHATRAILLTKALLKQTPSDLGLRNNLGSLTAAAGSDYIQLGELEHGGTAYRESIETREALLKEQPNDAETGRNLLVAYGNYATLLGIPWSPNLGRSADARVNAAKGVAIARAMAAIDPNDATARRNLGFILGRLGMIEPENGGNAASLTTLEEAQRLIEPIEVANPKSSTLANQLALLLEYKGHRLEALGRTEEARRTYERGLALLQPFIAFHDNPPIIEYLANQQSLALLDASSGNTASALSQARSAVQLAEKFNRDMPSDPHLAALARAWSTLALVKARTGSAAEARADAEQAIMLWNSVKKPSILTEYRKPLGEAQALLQVAGQK